MRTVSVFKRGNNRVTRLPCDLDFEGVSGQGFFRTTGKSRPGLQVWVQSTEAMIKQHDVTTVL